MAYWICIHESTFLKNILLQTMNFKNTGCHFKPKIYNGSTYRLGENIKAGVILHTVKL